MTSTFLARFRWLLLAIVVLSLSVTSVWLWKAREDHLEKMRVVSTRASLDSLATLMVSTTIGPCEGDNGRILELLGPLDEASKEFVDGLAHRSHMQIRGSQMLDCWEKPIFMRCSGKEKILMSLGPNGNDDAGLEDDITHSWSMDFLMDFGNVSPCAETDEKTPPESGIEDAAPVDPPH